MSLPLKKFRELVFQLLYSQEFYCSEKEDAIPFMMQEFRTTKRITLEAYARMQRIQECTVQLDETIQSTPMEYSWERISPVEKTILRMGVFEMCFDASIPEKVAIAEAIRLCRKYGTPESSHFVNALLDRIYKEHGSQLRNQPDPV